MAGRKKSNSDKRWKYGAPPAGNANFAWVLLIDARKLGGLVDRTQRELTDDELARSLHNYGNSRRKPRSSTRPSPPT